MQSSETKERTPEKEIKIQNVGLRLKEVRITMGYSQQDFASCLNTSTGFISEIESGKKLPGAHLLHSLWRKFNLNANWLLTGKGSMFNSNSNARHSQENWTLNAGSDNATQQELAKLAEENERLRQRVQLLESQVALLSDLIIRIKKED